MSAFIATPVLAAGAKNNVGINLSLDDAFGLQGEYNISSMVENAPISVQAFWKKETDTAPFVDNDHTALGVAGIYDLSSVTKIDKMGKISKKMTPYVGIGIARETTPLLVTLKKTETELYITTGLRYAFSSRLSGEVSYNNIFDLAAGLNFNF